MKFEVNKANLLKDLKILQHIATSKLAKTNPALENLLIETRENKLVIIASNISTKGIITVSSGLKIEKEGRILVNAQKFVSVVETFKENINFNSDEKQLIISEGKTKITLPLTTLEYPENLLKFGEYKSNFTIPSDVLKEGLSKVVDFRVLDSAEIIGGISFKICSGDKKLKLCATNGNILAVMCKEFESISDADFILPGDFSLLLSKSISGDILKMGVSEKKACFVFENIALETLLISGTYPKYEALIPNYFEANAKVLTVEKKVLEDLFKKISVLKDFVVSKTSDGKTVRLYNIIFECGMLTKVRFSDKLEDYLAAEYKGDPIKIAFNPEYLERVLKAIEADKITFLMDDNLRPILFKEGDYTALIMPVQIRG